jgi:uncharacterized protein (TIGR02996 family)
VNNTSADGSYYMPSLPGSERLTFIRRIHANRDDQLTLVCFADWLAEHDEAERGESMRALTEPTQHLAPEHARRVREAEWRLFSGSEFHPHRGIVGARPTTCVDPSEPYVFRAQDEEVYVAYLRWREFERFRDQFRNRFNAGDFHDAHATLPFGLVETLTCRFQAWTNHGDRIAGAQPIREVTFGDAPRLESVERQLITDPLRFLLPGDYKRLLFEDSQINTEVGRESPNADQPLTEYDRALAACRLRWPGVCFRIAANVQPA